MNFGDLSNSAPPSGTPQDVTVSVQAVVLNITPAPGPVLTNSAVISYSSGSGAATRSRRRR